MSQTIGVGAACVLPAWPDFLYSVSPSLSLWGVCIHVATCDSLGPCCAVFCVVSDEDEQFKEEKQTIIAAISKLGPSDAEPTAGQQQEQGHSQPLPTLPDQQQPAQGQQPEGVPAAAAGVDAPMAAAAAGQQQPDTEGSGVS